MVLLRFVFDGWHWCCVSNVGMRMAMKCILHKKQQT